MILAGSGLARGFHWRVAAIVFSRSGIGHSRTGASCAGFAPGSRPSVGLITVSWSVALRVLVRPDGGRAVRSGHFTWPKYHHDLQDEQHWQTRAVKISLHAVTMMRTQTIPTCPASTRAGGRRALLYPAQRRHDLGVPRRSNRNTNATRQTVNCVDLRSQRGAWPSRTLHAALGSRTPSKEAIEVGPQRLCGGGARSAPP